MGGFTLDSVLPPFEFVICAWASADVEDGDCGLASLSCRESAAFAFDLVGDFFPPLRPDDERLFDDDFFAGTTMTSSMLVSTT